MRITMVAAAMLSSVAPHPGEVSVLQTSVIDRTPATGPKHIGGIGISFPIAVPDIYATMDASNARLQTCMDQYIENTRTKSNGNLSWEDYYPMCDDRLIR